MRVLAYFVQVLVALLAVRLVLRALARLALQGGARAAAPPPPGPLGEDLVHDRVCRTHLPRSRAIAARVAGRQEHFCSTACRDKALAELARAS